MNTKFYKTCAVPMCNSTTITTPEKLFIHVPKDKQIRRMWLRLSRRDIAALSTTSTAYFCEDHFDLPTDMENYVEYTTMGMVSRIIMKPGCLPRKFACQPDQPSASPDLYRSAIVKRQRPSLIKECEEQEKMRIDVFQECENLSNVLVPSRSSAPPPRDKQQTKKNNKAVPVIIKPKYRNKQTQTVINTQRKETSPQRVLSVCISTSPFQTEVSTNGNEIKVFCPNCNTEVSHTAEGIQQDQTKILIAKVYHYFEQEYKELKMIYGDLDLAPLSNFYQRTTLATGVSEAMLMQILKQEERRNEERQREPPPKERAARKRRRQTTYSSSEEYSSDGNVEDIEQPSPPEETLVVKIEPPEYSFVEPEIFVPAAIKLEPSDSDVSIEEPEIFIPAVKVEPSDDDTNKKQTDPIGLEPVTHEDDTAQRTPASETSPHTKRKAKKTPKLRDETLVLQQTQVECSSSAASRSKRRATEESPLPGEVEIKLEEGFS